MQLICTKLEFENQVLTGFLSGKNCNGEQKKVRILEKINLEDYPSIVAYGDTKGDLAMFSLAEESFYKPFRK